MTLLSNAYKISRRVAVGDLAEVLLAAQHGFGGMEKLVVVKRVLPHLRADPHFVQIFVEEARAAAGLKHQHVAETYDVIHDEYDLCLITEYLSGEDVSFLTRSYGKGELKIPVPIACRIISQVADGLHYAHTRQTFDGQPAGMLHRDISPGNVIVTYNGVAKLTDFGIARADVQNIYARPATVKLKLAYRSPERIQHKELDTRSDVYSLGVLLYEMLVGRRLFRGENEASVLKNVMELKVPPPSQLNSDISPQLDELVLQTLDRDLDTRTPSAQHLRQGLETILTKGKQFVSEHEVHVWLTSSLKARYTERQRMERSVVAEGRDVSRLAAVHAELPPMFGGFSGSEVTVTPSATSVSTMVGRAGTAQVPLYGVDPRRRSRTLLLSLIASVATLVIVIVFAFAYWLGRRNPTVLPEEVQPRVSVPKTSGGTSPAAFFVHASPGGASLAIDGQIVAEDVGMQGVLLPVPPEGTVTLTLRKEGHGSRTLKVRAPKAGTKDVYISLIRGDGGADDPPGSSDAGAARRAEGERGAASAAANPSRSHAARAAGKGTRSRSPRPVSRAGTRRSSAARGASLEVIFTPPNASLTVGGVVRRGRSPLRISDLSAGYHRVVVSAPGFETQTRRVQLRAGERGGAVTIRLPRRVRTAPVSIASEPRGAVVRIDGESRGRTPLRGLRLPTARTYLVEVALPGYRVWKTRLKVELDTASSIEATLIRK